MQFIWANSVVSPAAALGPVRLRSGQSGRRLRCGVYGTDESVPLTKLIFGDAGFVASIRLRSGQAHETVPFRFVVGGGFVSGRETQGDPELKFRATSPSILLA